jgi:hypothetical protein
VLHPQNLERSCAGSLTKRCLIFSPDTHPLFFTTDTLCARHPPLPEILIRLSHQQIIARVRICSTTEVNKCSAFPDQNVPICNSSSCTAMQDPSNITRGRSISIPFGLVGVIVVVSLSRVRAFPASAVCGRGQKAPHVPRHSIARPFLLCLLSSPRHLSRLSSSAAYPAPPAPRAEQAKPNSLLSKIS